jgi:hypothetical protein
MIGGVCSMVMDVLDLIWTIAVLGPLCSSWQGPAFRGSDAMRQEQSV